MSDQLFELIKALDKNEKGYFKKFAARYGEKTTGNDYLKMFDLLDKADDYNEDALKAYYGKNGKKLNLSAQKSYLYAQIIRSLRSYHTANNSSYRLTENLLDIQNLTDKGLDDQAMDLINDSIRKAQATFNLNLEFQLKTVKQSLMIRHIARYSPEEMNVIYRDLIDLNEKIGKSLVLENLGFSMKILFDTVVAEGRLTDEIKSKADEIIKHPVFEEGLAWGFNARGKIYNAQYLYACINSNDIEALKYLKLTNEMFKTMELDTKTTYQYLANISNIVLIALNLEQMKEAGLQLYTLDHMRFKDPALETYRRKLYSKNELMYLTVVSQHRELSKMEILLAETNLLSCANPLMGNNNLMSCFYLAILFYVVGERDKTLTWLQKTIAHEKVNLPLVQAYARVLVALVYYEQENLSLTESTLNNVTYFMKKNEISSEYLKQAISALTRLQTLPDKDEKKAILTELGEWVEEATRERTEDDYNSLFDFNLLFWCKSYLNKTTYARELRAYKAQTTTNQAG